MLVTAYCWGGSLNGQVRLVDGSRVFVPLPAPACVALPTILIRSQWWTTCPSTGIPSQSASFCFHGGREEYITREYVIDGRYFYVAELAGAIRPDVDVLKYTILPVLTRRADQKAAT